MKRNLTIPAAFFLALALICGCANDSGKIGAGVSDPAIEGEVLEVFLYPSDFAAPVSEYYSLQINSGQSLNLFCGSYKGFETGFLLKFTDFAALPDSFILDSAVVKVTSWRVILDSAYIPLSHLDISVHQLTELRPNSDWNESSVTWDSVASFSDISIHDFSLPADYDTHTVSFRVDPSIASGWIYADSLNPNTGLIFYGGAGAEFIRNFCSSENFPQDSLYKPQLWLFLTVMQPDTVDTTVWHPGWNDTLVSNATHDVYIARDTAPLDDSLLYIGRSVAYRSLFRFDLSEVMADNTRLFPRFGVYVNLAEFVLFVDSESPLYFGDKITACTSAKPTSLSWVTDPSSVEYEPTYYGPAGTIIGDSLRVNITSLFNRWVQRPEENFGFAVKFSAELNELARVPFFNPSPGDTLNPKQMYFHVIMTRLAGEGD